MSYLQLFYNADKQNIAPSAVKDLKKSFMTSPSLCEWEHWASDQPLTDYGIIFAATDRARLLQHATTLASAEMPGNGKDLRLVGLRCLGFLILLNLK